jgi:methionine sulfoxide reductase heme-binding subunit
MIVQLLGLRSRYRPFLRVVRGRRVGQWFAYLLAASPSLAFAMIWSLFVIGSLSHDDTVKVALAAVEIPGLLLLVAMMWCTPWSDLVGRPYRRERRAFGIGFAATGFGNLIMFLESHRIGELSRPFAIAATFAVVCTTPLLATSSRRSIRKLGAAAWRKLHRLAYLAAVAVVVHLWLVPQDDGPGGNIAATVLVGGALLLRLPRVRKRVVSVQRKRRTSLLSLSTWVLPPATQYSD